jgi:hypothetical protein
MPFGLSSTNERIILFVDANNLHGWWGSARRGLGNDYGAVEHAHIAAPRLFRGPREISPGSLGTCLEAVKRANLLRLFRLSLEMW